MKKKYKILTAVLAVAALVCASVGIWKWAEQKYAGQVYDKLKTQVREDQTLNIVGDESVRIPINFETLKKQNPDVYAWITVPGTEIDYPILQNEVDNTYYLTHTIERENDPAGSIFTETYNTKDFEDPNTVIYGHDMKNGSMFRGLRSYRDRTFFDEHREVLIYTPDTIRTYKIFAAYVYDDRHLLLSYDFHDRSVYEAYLNSIFSIRGMNAIFDPDVELTADDKIITLSTCYANQSDKRYLVQAVLVDIRK